MDSSLYDIINIELLKVLLNSGADVDKVDNHDYTALMRASSNGRAEVVKLLLATGANVNVANGSYTALKYATLFGHVDVVMLLRQWKTDAQY